MKRTLAGLQAYLILTPLLAGCASAHAASVPTDQALAKAMLGVWCVSEDQGKSCQGYDYIIDGENATACGTDSYGESFWGKAKYVVLGSEVCFEMTETSHPEVTPVGYRFCSTTLSIDAQKKTYKFPDADKVYTMFRTSLTELPCLDGE